MTNSNDLEWTLRKLEKAASDLLNLDRVKDQKRTHGMWERLRLYTIKARQVLEEIEDE